MNIEKIGKHLFINGDTNEGMQFLQEELAGFDYILTSPPYNAHRTDFYNGSQKINDSLTPEQHRDWIVSHFKEYEKLLNPNGVIIYNINYMSSVKNNASNLFRIITAIEDNTDFVLIEQICWKKQGGQPSKEARLTRVWENVFIFIRRKDWKTFHQKFKDILTGRQNYFEAPNNDYTQDINKACFSSEMVYKLLKLYEANQDSTVLDNFMGTGTTFIGCEKIGCKCVGIELDEKTYQHSKERLKAFQGDFKGLEDETNLFNINEDN